MKAYSRTTGRMIVGTADTVACMANLILDSFRKDEDGDIDFEFEGETEVFWDSQKTDTDDVGNRYFYDENGDLINETDIELRPE